MRRMGILDSLKNGSELPSETPEPL
jgi:hypothetical protein